MDIKQAITASLNQANVLVHRYLDDLTAAELLARPCAGANHIAWQLGHLIVSERHLVEQVAPGKMPDLPAGFAEQHKKEAAAQDAATAFWPKDDYLALASKIREGTLRVVADLPAADFDKPVTKVPPFLKTAGETLLFVGPHWIMHAGQWAIIRRTLGRPPLF